MPDTNPIDIRRLDFALLLVFLELVRHRRTTVAAERLGLSQSAVSHALGRLRDIFGDALFLRKPNGLEPTRRALELAPKVEEVVTLMRACLDGAARFDPATSDRLFRLAGNDLVCSLLMPTLLPTLARRAPKARATVRFLVGREALDALRTDQIDLALGRVHTLPDGFDAIPLWEERFAVVLREGHPEAGEAMDLERYLKLEHILVSFTGGVTGMVDLALQRMGFSRRVVASVPMFLAAFSVVAGGDLVATAPERLAARHAAAFGLRVLPAPTPIDPFSIAAVRHARSRGDAGLDWLLDLIREVNESLGPAPEGGPRR